MVHRSLALIGLLVVTASCMSNATTQPSSVAPTAQEGATVEPKPADADGLVAPATTIKDAKNDLVDQDGNKAPRSPHIDLIQLGAAADGTDLRMSLTTAGDIPSEMSSLRQELNYLVVIEADGSGEGDYWVTLGNLEAGDWSVAYTDWATGQGYYDDTFPGSFLILDNRLSITMSLTALGSPSSLRLSAITQLVDHETGDVLAEDQIPKGEQYLPAAGWLALGS